MDESRRMRPAWRALLIVSAMLLAGCGGGSSSITSSSSGSSGGGAAVLQGQVVSRQSAAAPRESHVTVMVRRVLGVGLAEAQLPGTPVAGATVRLKQGACGVATTTTDSHGQFIFRGVTPGIYTVEVEVNGQIFPANVTVGAGDQAIVGVALNGATTVQVTAASTDVFNNDAQLGHAVNIADASSSCDIVQVTHLREQGLGWGDIARRCNVSPGVIGLGRSNLSDSTLDDVRERRGHGRKHGKGKA